MQRAVLIAFLLLVPDVSVWMVSDERTAVTQSFRTRSVYVFKFDEDLTSATIFKFNKDTDYRVAAERR